MQQACSHFPARGFACSGVCDSDTAGVNAIPQSGLTASASQQPCVVTPPSDRGLLCDTFSSFKSFPVCYIGKEGGGYILYLLFES